MGFSGKHPLGAYRLTGLPNPVQGQGYRECDRFQATDYKERYPIHPTAKTVGFLGCFG